MALHSSSACDSLGLPPFLCSTPTAAAAWGPAGFAASAASAASAAATRASLAAASSKPIF